MSANAAPTITLVTGASRGLGRNTALHVARQGGDVILTFRSKADEAQAVVAEIVALGRKAVALQLDTGEVSTFPDFVERLRAALRDTWQRERFDHLVNNAGHGEVAPIAETTEAQFDRLVNVHFKGVFFLTQALLPQLRAAATSHVAKVINIASIDGISTNPQETYSYQASKAGLIQLTRRMAVQLAPENIAVTAIAPGAFASEMNTVARDHAEETAKRIPARRVGVDDDMAGAAIYLASKAGDYVVGSTIIVDGGVTHAR